jgi:transposase InsO family protein
MHSHRRFSRRVLAWRVSITMEAEFCIEAAIEALARHGRRTHTDSLPGQSCA